MFWRNWLFAGHTCDLAEPGDFFTFEVGTESLLVVRDAGGVNSWSHANCDYAVTTRLIPWVPS